MLYCCSNSNPFTNYVQIVAKYTNATFEYIRMSPEDAAQMDINIGAGALPILQTEEGMLNEPNAISRYLCNLNPDLSFYGSTVSEQSTIDQVIEKHSCAINGYLWKVVLAVTGHVPLTKEDYAENTKQLKNYLMSLDSYLKGRF